MEDFTMNKLLSTTALVLALGSPTLLSAQTAAPAPSGTSTSAQTGSDMTGFLAGRSDSDLYVSDLIGEQVYARRTPREATTDGAMMLKSTDLESMDNIGEINEIILTSEGEVRAVIIGAGGFLGIGDQDVAVTMDQVTFARDADDQSEMYVVVNTGAETFKQSLAYDRSATATGNAAQSTASATASGDTTQTPTNAGERTRFMAPDMARDGYNRVEATQVSTEMVTGKTVYSPDDQDVGSVEDMIVDDTGKITDVIIDFGGFFGLGSSQTALGFDELTVLSNEGNTDVRVYVNATKEQIQSLPKYEPAK
jgi:sporulation protein YlmC with PRC-barrel domain